jgi:ubiquinone/menaquinone biosynthesis C-methylase UbiE
METITMSTIGSLPGRTNLKSTATTRRRYQRIARFYDVMCLIPERHFQPWRKQLWSLVKGPQVLEVGVGTGRNIEFYREGVRITAIDLTPGMLEHAHQRAQQLGKEVDLCLMDVQNMDFPEAIFDTVVATCVFCSVPDPVLGLREVLRVTKPGGRVLLLEHVRSKNPTFGAIMDFLNPLVVRVMGSNINRRTVENAQRAGLEVESVTNLDKGHIFNLIVARRNGMS